MTPNSILFLTDEQITRFVYGKFFRCISPFLSWMKENETYWFEYILKGIFEIRSDNNKGKRFEMETYQLLKCFIPCDCEYSISNTQMYLNWLDSIGMDDKYVKEKLMLIF